MIYEKATLYFPQGSSTWMTVICNYFNQFSNRFHLEDNYIVWDNKVKFTLTAVSNPRVYLKCNDSQSTVLDLGDLGYWNRASSQTWGNVVFILTDTLFYFTIIQTEGGRVWDDTSGEIVAIVDDNNNYFAGFAYRNYNANAVPFYDVDTALSGYSIGTMFKFNVEAQKILLSNICPVSYNGGYFSTINTLVNCSNITQGIVITINGKNYYTVGTNILIPIDD